jgi:hypothetical protein
MFFQEFQEFMQSWNRVFAYEVFSIESQKKSMQVFAPLEYSIFLFHGVTLGESRSNVFS